MHELHTSLDKLLQDHGFQQVLQTLAALSITRHDKLLLEWSDPKGAKRFKKLTKKISLAAKLAAENNL